MDRFSESKAGENEDFIPLPPTPVTSTDMEVILAPFRQELNIIADTLNGAVATYDHKKNKAGTITSALYNLTRCIDDLEKKVKEMQSAVEDSDVQEEIADLRRMIRQLQETVNYQTERFEDFGGQLSFITNTLVTISDDIAIIKQGSKREREPVHPAYHPYGWPVGFDPNHVEQPRYVTSPRAIRISRDGRDDRDRDDRRKHRK
jgi:hypothetical protein